MEITDRNVEGQNHRNSYENNSRNEKMAVAKITKETKCECENENDADGQKSELQEQHRSKQPDLKGMPRDLAARHLLRLVFHGVFEFGPNITLRFVRRCWFESVTHLTE